MLVKAAATLRQRRLRLVVFDAYRPLSVQRLLWQAKPSRRYVAPPDRGSSHNRGGGIDVALASLDGTRLEMPTGFDDFGPRARHGADGVPVEARRNADLLKSVLEAAGFKSLVDEWWHYHDPASKEWPLLDVPFEELAR